jgi:WD40 repeat protein
LSEFRQEVPLSEIAGGMGRDLDLSKFFLTNYAPKKLEYKVGQSMWDIQPDWSLLDTFYVRIGGKQYRLSKSPSGFACPDPSVAVQSIHARSFRISLPDGESCTFLGPKRNLDIHNGVSIGCVDVTPDGSEVLSGDSQGHLFLTHLGTEPIPFTEPSRGFDIEDCLVDSIHNLFLAASIDFRIYQYSSTEYEFTGKYEGHTASVTRLKLHDGNLYSGSRDRTVCLWNVSTRQKTATIAFASPVNDFCFTSDDCVIAACETAALAIDIRTGQPSVSPPYSRADPFLCVDSLGDELTVGLENGKIVQWDRRNMEHPIAEWSWFDAAVNRLGYINRKLWIATNDGTAGSIDAQGQKSTILLGTRAYAPVRDFATDGLGLWTANGEGLLQYFDF